MMLTTTLDRYIARHLMVTISLTLLVLAGMGFIGLFMANVNKVGIADYTYGTLFYYVLLGLPQQIYEIFPAAALVGTSSGLSLLALSSELTAMRAAGVSLFRIVASVLKLCLVLVLLAVFLGEWVVPNSLKEAERVRAAALHQPQRDRVGIVWLRSDDRYIRIAGVMPDRSLKGVSIFELAGDTNGYQQTEARRAVYRNRQWVLLDVEQTRIAGNEVQTVRLSEQPWSPGFGPGLMQTMQIPKQTMSTRDLLRYVQHLKDNQQESSIYEISLWKKLVLPFSTLIMVMLAVPFVFGSVRTGGLGKRVFIGIMIGFVFSLLQSGMGYYSLSFGVSPAVAALTPSIIFLCLTGYLFYRAVRVG